MNNEETLELCKDILRGKHTGTTCLSPSGDYVLLIDEKYTEDESFDIVRQIYNTYLDAYTDRKQLADKEAS